jgi:Transcriptional regulator, AbiEi antitoxin, Type IV TA system/Transcriptional regulator, AbiEi antitoxin N-terminal domain
MHSMAMQKTVSDKPFDSNKQSLSNESLEKILPEGLVVDRAWLYAQGVSRPNIDYYLRTKRLEAVARGAYRRPGPPLKWEHFVYSLQALGYSVHVGGRAALELQGYTHYLSMSGKQQIDLYGVRHIPASLLMSSPPIKLVVHSVDLFNEVPTEAITTKPFGHWDWLIKYATPELALLELLSAVNSEADFSVMDKFFESAVTLRPSLLNNLLGTCKQVKAKRLFLWFANRYHHAWLKQIEASKINLGSGKRVIVTGGALDKQYQITVPREMQNKGDKANGTESNFF